MTIPGLKRPIGSKVFTSQKAAEFLSTHIRRGLQVGLAALLLGAGIASASAQGNEKRGQYLSKAAGCVGCHTADKKGAIPFSGGRALKTPFGTFFGPNITPDPQAGIGRWAEVNFIRAMRLGIRPDGAYYYPAFPYPSFTGIADDDLRDLWAFLRTLPPSSQADEAHDLRFPFTWRSLLYSGDGFFLPPVHLQPMVGYPRWSREAPIWSRPLAIAANATHRGIFSVDRNGTDFSAEGRGLMANGFRI